MAAPPLLLLCLFANLFPPTEVITTKAAPFIRKFYIKKFIRERKKGPRDKPWGPFSFNHQFRSAFLSFYCYCAVVTVLSMD